MLFKTTATKRRLLPKLRFFSCAALAFNLLAVGTAVYVFPIHALAESSKKGSARSVIPLKDIFTLGNGSGFSRRQPGFDLEDYRNYRGNRNQIIFIPLEGKRFAFINLESQNFESGILLENGVKTPLKNVKVDYEGRYPKHDLISISFDFAGKTYAAEKKEFPYLDMDKLPTYPGLESFKVFHPKLLNGHLANPATPKLEVDPSSTPAE